MIAAVQRCIPAPAGCNGTTCDSGRAVQGTDSAGEEQEQEQEQEEEEADRAECAGQKGGDWWPGFGRKGDPIPRVECPSLMHFKREYLDVFARNHVSLTVRSGDLGFRGLHGAS